MAWWKPWGNAKRQSGINLPEVNIKTYRQEDFRKRFDSLGTPTRDEALEYVALFRCVTLLMNQCAELVSESLRVVDRDGRLVRTEHAKQVTRVLRENPNGFQSGRDFIRDIASDFLLEGNSLVYVDKTRPFGGIGARVKSINRLNAEGASIILGNATEGLPTAVYHARLYGTPDIQVFPTSRVAHARLMPPSAGESFGGSRDFFSESALHFLRKAIYIGKHSDAWVGDFFDEGARNNMAIMIPQTMSKQMQEKQIQAYERTLTDKRAPLILFEGATVTMLNPTPQDADVDKLRESSVQEIGRFYGIPAPLVNIQVTQWGSGIEQLARLHYRFSARQHLGVILDALSLRMLPLGQRFEVDSAQEVRGDTAAMSALAQAMRPTPNGPGVMSREEVRNSLGLHGEYKDDWNFDPYQDKNKGVDKPSDDDV